MNYYWPTYCKCAHLDGGEHGDEHNGVCFWRYLRYLRRMTHSWNRVVWQSLLEFAKDGISSCNHVYNGKKKSSSAHQSAKKFEYHMAMNFRFLCHSSRSTVIDKYCYWILKKHHTLVSHQVEMGYRLYVY